MLYYSWTSVAGSPQRGGDHSLGLTPAEVAYIELQGDSAKDAAALARYHELLA